MKKFYYFGIASAVIYIFAVILGGLIWPGYSHLAHAISALTMATSPNQIIMQPLFWAYNLLLIAFSIGYYRWGNRKFIKLSAAFLFLVAFSGIVMLIFPQDILGTPLTTHGLIHLIFAGVAALSTLEAMFLCAIGFWKNNEYKNLSRISLVLGVVVLASGPFTAIAPTALPQFFGLSERITIGSFIVWLFLASYIISKQEKGTIK
ncbi:MAG: DUF998 domain-containing protein [Candidatus Saccharibacteria bacterium]|nr:DUF998 domain-containing protein [Candidatus Saccharibacteria bacterium]